MADNKKNSFFGLGILLGTVIGGLTAFFLSPSSGKENREEVAKKVKELKRLLQEHELDKKVKEIFGEVTEEAKKFYFNTKDKVIEKVAELKGKVSEIDKEKYAKLVESVVHELKKEAKYTEKILEKLEKNLAEDWKKITG